MGTKKIVIGYAPRLGERVESVDPLLGNDELHERLFLVLHQFYGARSNRRHLSLLLAIEENVRLAGLHLLRFHLRHVHVVILVPLGTVCIE